MRFEEEIYFSKNYQWASINVDDGHDLLIKFKDRIQTLYLDQVTILNNADSYYNSFAVGALLFTAMDFLGGYLTKKKGFKNRLETFLKESDDFNSQNQDTQNTLSKMITENFRNGVIHDGRVKSSCQFDYDFEGKLLVLQDEILIINNKYLEALVIHLLEAFTQKVISDNKEMETFINRFRNDFDHEIKRLID